MLHGVCWAKMLAARGRAAAGHRGNRLRHFDLVIIGAGVAGLTAAMFGARQGLKTAVVTQMGAGGQIISAERILNFPGFPQAVAGYELGPLLHEQAEAAGAEFLADTIKAIKVADDR